VPATTTAAARATAARARLAAVLGLPALAPGAPPALPAGAVPPPAGSGAAEPALPPLLDPGRRGLAALVAVALLAVLGTGFVVWRGRPRAVDVPPPVVVASATAPVALLVVDVEGAVRTPGLVRLPAGSRVADALRAAGGVRPGTATTGLNLARKVVDGEQLLVGATAPPAGASAAGPAAGSPAPGALLDLNAATAEQLDALPGIGPVLADRIVQWRTAHGRFTSVDQLREISGIGARKYDSIHSLVTV
jgi:competence protein ComEA